MSILLCYQFPDGTWCAQGSSCAGYGQTASDSLTDYLGARKKLRAQEDHDWQVEREIDDICYGGES